MSDLEQVASIDEIESGGRLSVIVDDTPVLLIRIGDQFYAIDNHCPHAGASLAHGRVEGDVVRCRIHHWGFCLRDGVYVDEDKPAYNARTFTVRVVDDEVQVFFDQ